MSRLSLGGRLSSALEARHTVSGEPSVDLSLFDRHAVAFDRVTFASERRRERVNRFLSSPAERRGEVSAESDQTVGSPDQLIAGETEVLQLSAEDGGRLLVGPRGQTDGGRGVLSEAVNGLGLSLKHRVDRAGRLLEVRGGLNRFTGEAQDRAAGDGGDPARLVDF